MHLLQTTSSAAWLALLLFASPVTAESDVYNQNLTLRFLPATSDTSCAYSTSTSALTFTTSSIPVVSRCFDFADLFAGNASTGFVNQTRNLGGGSFNDEEAGIHWQLENRDVFDSQANYSRVLYRQHVENPGSDEYKPGRYAERRVTLYGGKRCTELDREKDVLLPWYGFSCWSEDEGSCGTMPYSVASFSVQPGPKKGAEDGTCWVFAERGAATSVSSSVIARVGGILGIAVAVWMGM